MSADEVMREAMIVSGLESAAQAEKLGLPAERIVISCKLSGVQDLIRVYRDLARRCDYALHLGLTEAGMGSKGIVASSAAMAVLLQEGIGDTIRVSLTPEPGGDRTREVVVAQELLQTMGLRSFTPLVAACPGCGRTTSTYFQELAQRIQSYLREQMPAWKQRYPGVEEMKVAVMGCVVNGPGESKHADVGISLPGTNEIAGRAGVRGRREDRDAQGRAHRRGVPGDRRALRGGELRARRAAPPQQGNQGQSGLNKVKPALLRGFDQEYLPQEQLQFNALVDVIRRNFELYGFLPIETPSAERKEVLTSKGGVEKEIYALSRLAAGADDDEAATKGALRFDLTVPLARYVAMRERELAFPFRRYQIQRVWRGETPQARKGRFREFYQCDIDIIGRDKLSYLAEAEIPSVIYSVFREMGIGEFRIRINNRKVLKGLLQHFSVRGAKARRPSCASWTSRRRKTRRDPCRNWRTRALSVAAARELFELDVRASETRARNACKVLAKYTRLRRRSRGTRTTIVDGDPRLWRAGLGVRRGSRRGARPGLLHRHDLRDHAGDLPGARQHLLGGAL